MYIPLDNLYDWIAETAEDIIIYRFFPHGSKKIQDFRVIDDRYRTWGFWHQWGHSVPVLCHDQEPLDFDAYDHSNLHWQDVRDRFQTWWPDRHLYRVMHDNARFWQQVSQMNLAGSACDTLLDRTVLLHSEKNSSQVARFQTLCEPVFWWSHAAIARDWYRYALHDRRLVTCYHGHEKMFNVYARAWTGTREYRLSILRQIQDHGLADHSRVSFNSRDGGHYSNHVFANRALASQGVIGFADSDIGSDASATYDVAHYNSCAIDLVLETLFDDDRLHVTEKTLRPIACGKPFLLAATPFTLRYLRSYGFRTFEGIFDESYDTVADPVLRMQKIIKEMQRLSLLSSEQKNQILCQAHAVAEFNRKHFFSDRFAQNITQELRGNLQAAVCRIRQNHSSGTNLIGCYRELDRARRDMMQDLMWHPDYRTHCAQSLRRYRSFSRRQSDHAIPVSGQ